MWKHHHSNCKNKLVLRLGQGFRVYDKILYKLKLSSKSLKPDVTFTAPVFQPERSQHENVGRALDLS
jgi:hypothetical protein